MNYLVTENSYTPAQASVIAKLPLKAVQKLIDARLIRPHRMQSGREIQRLLSLAQLVYPALNRKQVEMAPLYVTAFPRRGRPAQRPWAKKKPVRVTRQRRVVA